MNDEPGTIGVKGQLKIARIVCKGGDGCLWKQWLLQNAVGVRAFVSTDLLKIQSAKQMVSMKVRYSKGDTAILF